MKTKKTKNQKLQTIHIKKTIPTIHTQTKKKKKNKNYRSNVPALSNSNSPAPTDEIEYGLLKAQIHPKIVLAGPTEKQDP